MSGSSDEDNVNTVEITWESVEAFNSEDTIHYMWELESWGPNTQLIKFLWGHCIVWEGEKLQYEGDAPIALWG